MQLEVAGVLTRNPMVSNFNSILVQLEAGSNYNPASVQAIHFNSILVQLEVNKQPV